MRIRPHISLDERLSILREADHFRKWSSLDDRRCCVLCERIFSGRQIGMTRLAHGRFRLQCPTEGCSADPSRWAYPGNPFLSEAVYQDWWRALGNAEEQSGTASITTFRKPHYA
ncbi:MAG: hypothetical protein QOG67_91 [Verrucomicrobiota bacterium]|jgi:hypothetical protein